MKDGKAWVGDEVHDEDAGRTGMVTDVSGGVYFVRPLTGGGPEWTQNNPDRLTVTAPLDTGRLR
ncbi:hypothetical protein [Streptomyces sp. NPDC057438]|uniref:hypothetical protein n=1 Tax=Streptomyces sp. NPDC057438 TaxID=3346133 RepID=UPI0036AE04AC